MSDITHILNAVEQGDSSAAEQPLPLVYDELRRLAAAKLAHEEAGQTLQATALVHEAYIRLVDVKQAQHWDSARHFFSAAAESMKRILIENARRKQCQRYGAKHVRQDLREDQIEVQEELNELLTLDDALAKLTEQGPEKAELVKLRYFAGLTLDEAANALKISRATAARYWTYARAWLYRRMRDDEAKTHLTRISDGFLTSVRRAAPESRIDNMDSRATA